MPILLGSLDKTESQTCRAFIRELAFLRSWNLLCSRASLCIITQHSTVEWTRMRVLIGVVGSIAHQWHVSKVFYKNFSWLRWILDDFPCFQRIFNYFYFKINNKSFYFKFFIYFYFKIFFRFLFHAKSKKFFCLPFKQSLIGVINCFKTKTKSTKNDIR